MPLQQYTEQRQPGVGGKLLSALTGGLYGAATGMPAVARANDLRLQASIEEQKAKAQQQRQLLEEAAAVGASPVTMPDGSLNVVATVAETQKRKGVMEQARLAAELKTRQEAATRQRAAELNVPVNDPGRPAKQTAMFGAVAPKPLEARVFEAENNARIAQAAAESRARSEASAPFESQYQQGDNFAVNGNYIGRGVRNTRTGEFGIMGPDGQIKPVPEGAQPITATAINKNIVGATDFKKYKTDLTDSERSLRQFERYANSVGGLRQGLSGMADRFTAGMKTLLDSGQLNPQELAQKVASGQAQGLLGGNRVSVVGGGVMTETDAQRILMALGGDVGALQNKEAVMAALSNLYQDRFAQYEDDLRFYNEAVNSYWGAQGFDKANRTDYSPLFKQADAPAGGLTPEEQREMEELERKAAARQAATQP